MMQQATRRIAEAERILIISHVSPDGDAIGSLLGLGLALCPRRARVVMACADPVPGQHHHLPHWERIVQAPDGTFDLIVSLDCSDLQRLGPAYDAAALAGVPLLNIDHHATNVHFGTVNWVEPAAAATAQMLVSLVHELEIPFTVEIATCLLHGILTDTLGFRTPNTTPEVMQAAVELTRAGAPFVELTDRAFGHRPLSAIRLWGKALERMQMEGRIAWSEITQEMRQATGYLENGDAGLVNFMGTANEADMAVIFSELQDGQVDVSMRASAQYDVSALALGLGGGGHPQAAGCTLPGPLGSAQRRVLSLLAQAWQEQGG
jgi:bifunctional oligoribonuclease and PAP phosphatase NrnA